MVATFAQLKLAETVVDVFDGVRGNLRATAQQSLDGQTKYQLSFIGGQMRARGLATVARIERLLVVQAEAITAMADVYGIAAGSVTTEYTTLRDAAIAQRDTPADGSAALALAATTLANIQPYPRV